MVEQLLFLEGSDRRYILLTWLSRKLKWVVKSTLTAETLALQEVTEVAYMIRCLLLEMKNNVRTGKFDSAHYHQQKIIKSYSSLY